MCDSHLKRPCLWKHEILKVSVFTVKDKIPCAQFNCSWHTTLFDTNLNQHYPSELLHIFLYTNECWAMIFVKGHSVVCSLYYVNTKKANNFNNKPLPLWLKDQKLLEAAHVAQTEAWWHGNAIVVFWK